MRLPTVLLLACLTGCSPAPVVALAAVDLATVTVFGRGVVDIGVSAISGRDCSIVRLDKGLSYCAPIDAPVPVPYCTRSLGRVDCWASPSLLPRPPPGVAETPASTAAQDRTRAARWPKSLTAD